MSSWLSTDEPGSYKVSEEIRRLGLYLADVQERADHSYIQGFSASRSAIDQAHETIILRR